MPVDIEKRRARVLGNDGSERKSSEPSGAARGVDVEARKAKYGITSTSTRLSESQIDYNERRAAADRKAVPVPTRYVPLDKKVKRGAEAVAMPAVLINAAREMAEKQEASEFASRYRKQNRASENSKVGRDTFDSGVRAKYRARTEDAAALTKEHDRLSAEMSNMPFGAEDAARKMNEQQRDIERRLKLANNAQDRAVDYGEKKAFGQKYADIPLRADFAENSQNRLDADGGRESRLTILPGNSEMGIAAGAYYTNTGWGDDLKRAYINNVGNAREVALQNDIQTGRVDIGEDYAPYSYMEEREVGIYNYLYNTEGKDAAEEYLSKIEPELNARRRSDQMQLMEEAAREHPIAASALSLMTSPMRGATYIMQGLDYLEDGKIDQNAGYNKWSYGNTAIRNEVSRIAEEKWGKVGSFLYQTGMSMGDFLLNSGISGGAEGLSLAIMGTGAAADATIAAKDRGLSDDQAFALGTIAGAAEIFTEKFSMDALFKADWSKGALKNILINAFTEGSEEVASDLINTLADIFVAGDKSEWNETVNAYMAQGYSENEALGLAVADKAAEMGVSFAGGALSGGIMSMGGTVINHAPAMSDPRTDMRNRIDEGAGANWRSDMRLNVPNRQAQTEIQRDTTPVMRDEQMRGAAENSQPTAAQRTYNAREVEQFVQNGNAFGESGKKAFISMYDGGDFAAFYSDFAANYNAGVRGTTQRRVANRYSGTLTDAQALAAYSAGKNDAAAGKSAGQTSAGLKVYSYAEAGLAADTASLIADEGVRSTVDKMAKTLGVRVFIDEQIAPRADGSKVNGYVDSDGNMHIAADADALTTVFAHELTHRIQEVAPAAYEQYRRLVMEQLSREQGSDVNLVEQRKTEYKRGGVELSNEAAMDELAADYAQRIIGDPAKFAEVANENPNLARRLLNTLHNLIVRVKAALGNETARLERIETEWRRALSGAQRTVASAQQTAETSPMTATAQPALSYSIKTDENGGKYVEIDTDQHLFDNAPKKSYAAIARRVLMDRFAGQTLPLGENDLARLEARQAGEYAYPYTPLDNQSAEYNAKMRASTELDNLLETAEYSHWARDTKNHKEATLGFDYYKVKFVVDGHSFEGLANIANSENGRVFYDITKIEETSATSKKPAAGMAQSTSAYPKSQSISSISDSGEDVNAKFSRSAESIRYSISPEFASDIDAWSRAGRPAGESFVLGSTGEVLQGLGAIESDIYMLGDKISTIMNEHPEITLDEIKRIPEVLDDPVLILKSKGENRGGQNTRMVVFGAVKARNGQPMLAVLDLRPVENHLVLDDMQKVNSAYTRSNAWNYVSDGEIMYADEKRTIPLLRTIDLRSNGERSIELQRSGSIGSISYSGQNVNLSGEKFSDVVRVGGAGDTKFSLSSEEDLTDAAGQDIITDEERGAILQYKSSESYKINQALRDGIALTPEMQRIVDGLDSALPKLPKAEGTLYRTLNFDDVTDAEGELNNFLATHKVGELIRCSAFTSTSTTPDGYPLPEGVKCGVVMEIEGRSARSLEGFGNNFENEALYPRNTRFKVLSVEQSSDGIYRIKAKEVENNAEDLQGISGGDGTGRSPADLQGASTENDTGRPREIYQDGRPVERGEAVQQVQASEGINGDVQGISEVDTGRGIGWDRLPGVRAEGVDGEKFSLSGQKGRSSEVEYLRELNDYLREQMRMTSRPRMTQTAMNEIVKDVTNRWESAAKKSDIAEKLWRLYGEMASGKDADGGALAWETVRDEATEIAGEILNGAVRQSNPMYEEYDELRRTLKNTKISIAETDKADLVDVGGYAEFRQRNANRLALSKNGVPIDQVYDELHDRYGELFPASITHPADQLVHIEEVLDSLKPVYENVYSEQDMAEASDYIAAELIDGFYSVPTEGMETERVRAEKNAQIEQIKKDGREAMRRAVKAERESKARAVEDIKKQYEHREQRRADSATRQKLLKLMQRCERMKTTPQNKAKIADEWSNVWVEFDRAADDITKVFGVPYENVVNLINASARWATKGIFGKYLGDYYALRMTTNTSRKTEYYDCLWRAYKNARLRTRRSTPIWWSPGSGRRRSGRIWKSE